MLQGSSETACAFFLELPFSTRLATVSTGRTTEGSNPSAQVIDTVVSLQVFCTLEVGCRTRLSHTGPLCFRWVKAVTVLYWFNHESRKLNVAESSEIPLPFEFAKDLLLSFMSSLKPLSSDDTMAEGSLPLHTTSTMYIHLPCIKTHCFLAIVQLGAIYYCQAINIWREHTGLLHQHTRNQQTAQMFASQHTTQGCPIQPRYKTPLIDRNHVSREVWLQELFSAKLDRL